MRASAQTLSAGASFQTGSICAGAPLTAVNSIGRVHQLTLVGSGVILSLGLSSSLALSLTTGCPGHEAWEVDSLIWLLALLVCLPDRTAQPWPMAVWPLESLPSFSRASRVRPSSLSRRAGPGLALSTLSYLTSLTRGFDSFGLSKWRVLVLSL